jgi:hypothetical protein
MICCGTSSYGHFGSVLAGAFAWDATTPPGVMLKGYGEAGGSTHNPMFTFSVETDPRFTNASKNDTIKYGGELAAMEFEAVLYQHDDHLHAVMLSPWAFVKPSPTMGQAVEMIR